MDDLEIARRYLRKADNANRRGVEFTLTFQGYKNLILAKKCRYTGIELTRSSGPGTAKPTDHTIDRVDSTRGYVKGNVVACCHAANSAKAVFENPDTNALNINGAYRVLKATRDIIKKGKKK